MAKGSNLSYKFFSYIADFSLTMKNVHNALKLKFLAFYHMTAVVLTLKFLPYDGSGANVKIFTI